MTNLGTARAQVIIMNLVLFLFVLVLAGCGGGGGSSNIGRLVGASKTVEIFPNTDAVQAVRLSSGATVTLNGKNSSSTSTTGNPLTFDWKMISRPDGSKASLINPTSDTPSFKPDVIGSYRIQLVVSVDGVHSRRTVALVQVLPDGVPLWGVQSHNTLSNNCVSCHNDSYIYQPDPKVKVVPMSGDHPATSNMCQACHNTYGFASATAITDKIPYLDHYNDHKEVFGICSQCHNGTIAIGKSQYHQETTEECSICHNTTSFLDLILNPDGSYSYDHTGITDNCWECHDGIVATGKPKGHPPTQKDCFNCHTADPGTTFAGAFWDHSDLTGRCDSSGCHDGNSQITLLDGVTVVDIIGLPKTQPHPDYTTYTEPNTLKPLDCGICHYAGQSFNLDPSQGHQPYNHNHVDAAILRCDICHNNTIKTTYNTSTSNEFIQDLLSYGKFHSGQTHIDTSGADCGACHYSYTPNSTPPHTAFADVLLDGSGTPIFHNDPVVMAKRCDDGACHGNTADLTVVSLKDAPNHMPLPVDLASPSGYVDCKICHSPGTFTSGFYDHFDVVKTTDCEICHNDVITRGKPINHIPTGTSTCGDCHYDPAVASGFTTFAGAKVDHTLFTKGVETCGSAGCHDGATATGTNAIANHLPVPTGMDCTWCHFDAAADSLFTTFASTNNVTVTVAHADLPGGTACEYCHVNGDNYSPPAPGKNANQPHIPTIDTCDVCHDYNAAFLSTTSLGKFDVLHTFTSGCGGCHNGNFRDSNAKSQALADMPASYTKGHIPTPQQDCDQCHASHDPKGTFAGAVMDHKGITKDCASCHNANFKPSYGAAILFVPEDDANHPPLQGRDCIQCHDTIDFAHYSVDHTTLGPNPDCFTGCHDGSEPAHTNGALFKGDFPAPGTHPEPTSNDCSICHTAGGDFAAVAHDHSTDPAGVACSSSGCHADNTPGIKDKTDRVPTHPSTAEECSVCHNTTKFAGAKYDHKDSSGADIIANCVQCHDGNGAPGKKTGHVPSENVCENCHTTAGFLPAFNYDHNNTYVANSSACVDCHNGVAATGRPTPAQDPNHPQDNTDCGGCHVPDSANGWLDVVGYDHTGVSKNCNQSGCHVAGGKGKIYTASDNHVPESLGDCGFCHANTTVNGKLQADASFQTGRMDHTGITGGECGYCHKGTDTTYTYKAKTVQSSGHQTFSKPFNCTECHTTPKGAVTTNTSGASWTAKTFDHSKYTLTFPYVAHRSTRITSCYQCHTAHDDKITYKDVNNGQTVTNLKALPQTLINIYVAANYKNISGAPASVVSTNVSPYCGACHLQRYGNRGDHRSLAQDDNCEVCHQHSNAAANGGW